MFGDVAEVAEEIIRENCKELDIDVIDLAVNIDHVHLFIKYPPKYSVSWIAKRIKGRSSKLLRDQFPQLKEWCPGQFYDETWAMPLVVIYKAKGKTHKTGYITLHTKFFKGVMCTSQK